LDQQLLESVFAFCARAMRARNVNNNPTFPPCAAIKPVPTPPLTLSRSRTDERTAPHRPRTRPVRQPGNHMARSGTSRRHPRLLLPMGRREMQKTAGHWALSGPGWAAEWCQGGESGFLSIACGGDDDKAVATKTLEIPTDGKYFVWVRYGDWRENTERFQIHIEQTGAKPWEGRYGEN